MIMLSVNIIIANYMKEETFEQRRIVQLSKELDAERDKYSRLAKDSGFTNARFKEIQEEL